MSYGKKNLLLSKIYLIVLLLSVLFSLFIIWVGIENNFNGRPDLTFGRIIMGSTLLCYSLANIYVLRQKGFYRYKFAIFPLAYIFIGIISDYFHLGYIKDWAPATETIAASTNTDFLIFFIVLAFLITFITFYTKENVEST